MLDRREYDRRRAVALKRSGLCGKCKRKLGRYAYVCDECNRKKNAWARCRYRRNKGVTP